MRNAVAALAIFVGFTALVLVAWFARADAPWGFASFVAFVALLGAAAGGALLWRKPTRQSALAGLGAMAFSILRVGAPDQWTGTSVALLAITILLAVPVIQAAIALPRA